MSTPTASQTAAHGPAHAELDRADRVAVVVGERLLERAPQAEEQQLDSFYLEILAKPGRRSHKPR